MLEIGTPGTKGATKAMLLGSGELGKEVAIELKRFGIDVIACDKYEGAPAMQVATRHYVFNMLDGEKLREIVQLEQPDYIIPEIEAIATPTLIELEKEGYNVVPTARAAFLTMNREGIRRLATEELGIKTSPFRFASDYAEFKEAIKEIGIPCVVKPIMSSSGHGQSVVHSESDIETSWEMAQHGGRAGGGRVIVEGFVDFDYEITLLTARTISGTVFCNPIGHVQKDGDYQYSWQPQPMTDKALAAAKEIAKKVTDALGGYGIFGVEMFIKGDEVLFSEVSPRPHDTGMVTMISQDLSEFAIHARALLRLPIPELRFFGPSVSKAIVVEGEGRDIHFAGLEDALSIPGVQVRIFGKPEVNGHRRLGVILATADTIEEAKDKAFAAFEKIKVTVNP